MQSPAGARVPFTPFKNRQGPLTQLCAKTGENTAVTADKNACPLMGVFGLHSPPRVCGTPVRTDLPVFKGSSPPARNPSTVAPAPTAQEPGAGAGLSWALATLNLGDMLTSARPNPAPFHHRVTRSEPPIRSPVHAVLPIPRASASRPKHFDGARSPSVSSEDETVPPQPPAQHVGTLPDHLMCDPMDMFDAHLAALPAFPDPFPALPMPPSPAATPSAHQSPAALRTASPEPRDIPLSPHHVSLGSPAGRASASRAAPLAPLAPHAPCHNYAPPAFADADLLTEIVVDLTEAAALGEERLLHASGANTVGADQLRRTSQMTE